jgi:hypothetical protein
MEPRSQEAAVPRRICHVELLLVAAIFGVAAVIPVPAAAQIGRFPILAALPANGTCKLSAATADLRKQGIMTTVAFTNPASGRTISVSADARGRPAMMTAFIGLQVNARSESEYAMVLFGANGKVSRGTRAYNTSTTTGSPAKPVSQMGALAAADSDMAQRLAAQVMKRCGS